MSTSYTEIKGTAPSNIALIKYWGKHGKQLPNNPSVSISLKNAKTNTRLQYVKSATGLQLNYFFEEQQNPAFETKVLKFLKSLDTEFPFLTNYQLTIYSENTFPHSTGIASSASSMAALAFCLVKMEENITAHKFSDAEFLQRVSHIARLGSGSAARSVYPGYVTWGEIENVVGSSNLFASKLQLEVAPIFQKMGDSILIVSSRQKLVSSTLGHQLMEKHPFGKARYTQAKQNLNELLVALKGGDFDKFTEITENEALTLHGLLMTSSEDGLLLQPGTISIIQKIRAYRKKHQLKMCFTIDAGPNIHLLYPISEKEKVVSFIRNFLLDDCEHQHWIDDEMMLDYE